jgi:hypothetical protein
MAVSCIRFSPFGRIASASPVAIPVTLPAFDGVFVRFQISRGDALLPKKQALSQIDTIDFSFPHFALLPCFSTLILPPTQHDDADIAVPPD